MMSKETSHRNSKHQLGNAWHSKRLAHSSLNYFSSTHPGIKVSFSTFTIDTSNHFMFRLLFLNQNNLPIEYYKNKTI